MATIFAHVQALVMGLKRKLNYHQRLFIPIVGILWLIIIVPAYVQSQRESRFKAEALRAEIRLINQRAIGLYQAGEDPTSFIRFIDEYYKNSIFDDVSITIYDIETGDKIVSVGFDAPPPDEVNILRGTVKGSQLLGNVDRTAEELQLDPEQTFYYKEDVSDDGRIVVQTILPLNTRVMEEIHSDSWWLAFVLIAGTIMTIIIYFFTRHLTRNVKLLRDFASKAANERDFTGLDEFPNDELGEISREIATIYYARKAARDSRELEHRVALKATEERSALKRQLTNNISHELKTPIGIIRGYVDTMVQNPDMDDNSRNHFLSKTQLQVERLCNLLDDLSTMTRLEEASSMVHLDDIDFNELLSHIARDIDESGIAGDMEFVYDLPEDCHIKGNVNLMTSALMNLIKNAINYSKGTEMGVFMLTKNQRFYTFVFYDNGVGVAPEHIPHLFERFYRVDKGRSRKVGGTGLGLPIVRTAFNTMGGSVTVRNRQGGGLEFVFTIPIWYPKKETPDVPELTAQDESYDSLEDKE